MPRGGHQRARCVRPPVERRSADRALGGWRGEDQGAALVSKGDRQALPPQLEAALDAFLDESHSRQVIVLPLVRAPAVEEEARTAEALPPLGALVMEQFRDVALTPGFRESTEFLRQTATQALANATEHEGLFLAPVSRTLSKAWGLRRRPWTKIGLATVAAVIAGPVRGAGGLRSARARHAGAGRPARRVRGLGRGGRARARAAWIDRRARASCSSSCATPISRSKRTELANQVVTTQERLRAVNNSLLGGKPNRAERDRLHGERAQLTQTLESLQKQLASTSGRPSNCNFGPRWPARSSLGTCKTCLMHRPVERGQMLLSLADVDGEWELESPPAGGPSGARGQGQQAGGGRGLAGELHPGPRPRVSPTTAR